MSVENQWYVRLPAGNVITVSLDDLDAAFQRGDVTEETLVFRQGMKEWLPLGQAAGLDDADDTTQTAPPQVAAAAPSSMTPFAVPVSQPSGMAPYSAPYVDPSLPSTVRPVAFDTPGSFDVYGEEPQFKSSGRKKVVFGAIAVAAAIGLGVLGLSTIKGADASAAESNVAPKTAQMAAAAAPPPAATTIPEASPQGQNRLSDDQRKALMSFDDKQKADAAKRAADRAAKMPKPHGKRTKEKDVFVKGGNKYDPLNSSL
jgi:hypothetical protein